MARDQLIINKLVISFRGNLLIIQGVLMSGDVLDNMYSVGVIFVVAVLAVGVYVMFND